MADKPIRSMREFCERYFPNRHAARECKCFPPETEVEKFLRKVREVGA